MRIGCAVLLVLFSAVALAEPTPKLTGSEHAEVVLLLSDSQFDVRLAAKSLYRLGAGRRDISDLYAETAWATCSGARQLSADTLSWLAKALGHTKEARYAPLLDFCLAKITDKKVVKYFKAARDEITGSTTDAFVGGKLDLHGMRESLMAKSAMAIPADAKTRFLALRGGQSMEDVYTAFGIPDDIRGTKIPRGSAGFMYVHVSVTEDLITLRYEGLGTVRFAYQEGEHGHWVLLNADCDNGPFWSGSEGRFLTSE